MQSIQKRQGLLVASPEEVAFRKGLINASQLKRLVFKMLHTEYGLYLNRLADENLFR